MISYAQNAEDAVLARLFDEQEGGFYIDVGACHPVLDSVTKHFYDRGWSGVNIEPQRAMSDLLRAERPRDTNVHAAISDRAGTIVLYQAPENNPGASTVEQDLARSLTGSDMRFSAVQVPALTLGSLVTRYDIDHVDFLKIDVEGHEADVIQGVDWSTFRPRVLVVEAVRPHSTEPNHEGWQQVLLDHGYVCTLFDGINRFYAKSADERACKLLSVPANALDDFEPWRWVSQVESAKKHIADVEHARAIAERYAADLRDRRSSKP